MKQLASSEQSSKPGSALAGLNDEWRNWIAHNLARACNPQEMAQSMVADGQYSLALARAAIDEATGSEHSLFADSLTLPQVSTGSNQVDAGDRAVDVLFSLANPRVLLLGGVLSDEECAAMLAHCEQAYARSTVVDENDGGRVDASRTSHGAIIDRGTNAVADRIDRRLARIARWPVANSEPFQLQRYGPEQEYRAHYDWFNPKAKGHRQHLERGGQRVGTFILYLTDVEEGGGTAFPKLGIEIFPKKGNALFFLNVDEDHRPDLQTLHAGRPVVRGLKIVANKWLRQTAFAGLPGGGTGMEG